MKIKVNKLAQFTGHTNSIYALGLASNNKIYTGASDGFIVEWNLQNPDEGKLVVKVNRPVYSFLFLSEHNLLLSGTAQGNLYVIDLSSGKEIKNIEAHANGIFDIKLFNNFILTCGGDGKLNIWDCDFNLINSKKTTDKNARVIAVNNNKKEIAVGYSDNNIRIFNSNYKEINIISEHTNSVFALCFNNDFSMLMSGGRDAQLNAYYANNNFSLLKRIPAHLYHINSIAFNPAGNLFGTVSMDKTIKIWDSETLELLKVIDFARNQSHTNSINKILWLSNNEFVTCSDDKTAMVWQLVY
ncbi:MAG: WD40 repeat domain-containing protein [Bacteroidia bacterium]